MRYFLDMSDEITATTKNFYTLMGKRSDALKKTLYKNNRHHTYLYISGGQTAAHVIDFCGSHLIVTFLHKKKMLYEFMYIYI